MLQAWSPICNAQGGLLLQRWGGGGGRGRRDREVWWDIATALQINKSEQEKEITVLNVGFYMGFSNIPRVKGVKTFEKEALQYSEIFLLRFLLFVF